LVVVAGVVMLLLLTQAADAKMPYFSVETKPAIPALNLPGQVVVHFWSDDMHTAPADWNGPFALDDLFCVFPAGHVVTGQTGCPGGFAVSVRKQDEATYVGSFTTPGTGAWTLVAFPAIHRPLPAGYPDQVAIGSPPRLRGAEHATYPAESLLFAGALLLLLAVPVLVAERRRRVRERRRG
jgi:hypothetical protein